MENCRRRLVCVGSPRSAGCLRRAAAAAAARAGEVTLVGRVGIAGDRAEDVGPVGGAHRRADLVGRPAERGLAAGRQQQHLIAHVEVGQRVRDHQHHAAGVGQLAQHRHHLPVQRRVQARGRLVEDQQRRTGQQLQRHRGALALTAGELVDAGVAVLGHLEFLEHLRDDLFAVVLGGVRRQPQFGGVHQRLVDGQLAVHDVVLRHHADPGAQRGVLGVDVVALERHRAARSGGCSRRPAARTSTCRRRTGR